MNKKSLIKPFLIPLVFAILLMCIAVFFLAKNEENKQFTIRQNKFRIKFNDFIEDELANETNRLIYHLKAISKSNKCQTAWNNADKNTLENAMENYYKELVSIENITDLSFIKTDKIIFLSLGQNSYVFSNKVINKTSTELIPSSGLEVLQNGIPLFRVVYPWYINGDLKGYLQISKNIGNILHEVSLRLESDIVILVKKNQSTLQSENLLNHYIISETTTDLIPKDLIKKINQGALSNERETNLHIKAKNRMLDIAIFSSINILKKGDAYILVLADNTKEHKLSAASRIYQTMILLFIGFCITIIAYYYLKFIDKKMKQSEDNLHKAEAKIEELSIIIDEDRKHKEVEAITESDYFMDILAQADNIKNLNNN